MSGLRRDEAETRINAPIVARDLRGLIKINPIATWTVRRRRRVHQGPRRPGQPAHRAGIPVHRLLAVHEARRRRRRPAFGPLGWPATRRSAASTSRSPMTLTNHEHTRPLRAVAPRRDRGRSHLRHARGRGQLRATRSCSSAAARTRSSCCASPRRRFGPGASRSRSCTSTPGHNFPEAIEFRDRRVAELGERLDRRQRRRVDRQAAASSRRPGRARHATGCRPRRCSTPSSSTASTPRSAAPAATKRRRGPRSGSSASATSSASGTRRTSGPSCGASTTAGSARASTSAPSRSRTGPSSTCGSTSAARNLEIPSIYFSHTREVFERDGMLLSTAPFMSLLPGESRGRARRPLPHRRRHELHRRRRVDRRHPRRDHRRGRRRHASPSAAPRVPTTASPKPPWKTARRRATSNGAPSLLHRRLGRRRQVHADRPSALRRQEHLRGPARRRRRRQRAARPRLRQPGAAHRRPARRARAGHHHRRRLPLLLHAAAQVHHRRHARPHSVHAQHGHGRVDRRRRARARRRPQRSGRAEPAPHVLGHAAADPAHRRVHQQDGPRRLRREGLRHDPRRVPRVRHQARDRRPHVHPGLGAARATTSSTRRPTCRGTAACRC